MSGIYYVAAWKAPVGVGASDTYKVELEGYGKLNSPGGPFCVANEWIAQEMGRLLRLPIPPGTLVDATAGPGGAGVAWVSLNFSRTGVYPPPVNPADVVRANPRLAARLLIFDLLIANFDRHRGNLAFRPTSGRLEVFDHSHALLGITGNADAHLRAVRDAFLLDANSGGFPHTRHCLLDHLQSADDLQGEVDFVRQRIREPTLQEICDETVALNLLSAQDGAHLFLTLRHRRANLPQLLYHNRAEFTAIPDADWGLPI